MQMRLVVSYAVFIGLLAPMAGCRAPSLLITPVSGKRELVETRLATDGHFAFDKVAMIDVSGTIRNDSPFQLFGQSENPVSFLLEQLDAAANDPRVKAVILRINSPGGTVVASELMYDEIIGFRERTGKPVIAMMMDIAASGGYYIACACDAIVAQPSTVTGSIGVLMLTVDLSGTMHKIGVRTDAVVSGRYKDAGSPFRTMTPEEREYFQAMVNDMYGRFAAVVAKGRPELSAERVAELANGRVFTGQQAVEVGLVDQLAGPRETVRLAKSMAGLTRVQLVTYSRAQNYRPNYYASAPAVPAGDVNFIKLNLPETFVPPSPEFLYLWMPGR